MSRLGRKPPEKMTLKELREFPVDENAMYFALIELLLFDALKQDKECRTMEDKYNKNSARAFFFASVGVTASDRNMIFAEYLGFEDPVGCSRKIQEFILSGATTKDLSKLKRVFDREAKKLRRDAKRKGYY